MGRINAKIYFLVFALFLVSFTLNAETVSGVIEGVKFPEYDKNGNLQFMMYSSYALPSGVVIEMDDVLVDFVKKDVSVADLKDNRAIEFYSIDDAAEGSDKVSSFWKAQPDSKAFYKTSKASYNRATSAVEGDQLLQFRTESIDIDGVGFDMDQKTNSLRIRSNVTVVLRNNENDK